MPSQKQQQAVDEASSIDQLTQQLGKLLEENQALRDQNKSLGESVKEIHDRLAAVEKSPAPDQGTPSAPTVVQIQEPDLRERFRRDQEKIQARADKRAAYQRELLEQLQTGEIEYEVSLHANPTMKVGGSSVFEAEGKYRTYLGIRNTQHDVKVKELEPETASS